MVCEPSILSCTTPAEAGPVTAKLFIVNTPRKICVTDVVAVYDRLYKVAGCGKPLAPKITCADVVLVQTIEDVPALKVRFVVVVNVSAPVPLNVTVLLPRLIVRVLLLLEDRSVAVTLKLLVVKVPCVTVIVPEDVNASPSVTVIPDPFILS